MWWRKGFSSACSLSLSISIYLCLSLRNLETGSEAESMVECYLQNCSQRLAQLSYTIQDHMPRVGISYSKLGLTHQSLIKKMLPQTSHRPIGFSHILYWGSLFSDNFGWCQVDTKPTRTVCVIPDLSFNFYIIKLRKWLTDLLRTVGNGASII